MPGENRPKCRGALVQPRNAGEMHTRVLLCGGVQVVVGAGGSAQVEGDRAVEGEGRGAKRGVPGQWGVCEGFQKEREEVGFTSQALGVGRGY